jgi:hypothetical protein
MLERQQPLLAERGSEAAKSQNRGQTSIFQNPGQTQVLQNIEV